MKTIDPKYNAPKWWPKIPRVSPPKKKPGYRLTILGCGTSSGVPLIGCGCSTCTSKDEKNHRTRASAYLEVNGRAFLIDTTPDLRHQALKNRIHWIDAVLFTHPHADHIHGIDELRSFNYLMARSIPCYGNEWTVSILRSRFDYIFTKTQEGGGKPLLETHLLRRSKIIAGVPIVPIPLVHGELPVLGFRMKTVAYVTDCSYIPERSLAALKGLDVLVLDCLRPQPHPTHLNLESALNLAKAIGARRTFFTHMGHEVEYRAFAKSLPRSMAPAYDGLVIKGDLK